MRAIRLVYLPFILTLLLLCRTPATLAGADTPTLATAITFWHGAYPDVPALLVWQMVDLESGGNPDAYNPSGASGVLQYLPGTFAYGYRMEMNDTSYAPGWAARHVYDPMNDDLWSSWEQVHLTFYLLHEGYGCWWVSYARLTGAC